MPFNRSTGVAVLLATFVGLVAYRSGRLTTLRDAINGALTIGGR